MPNDTPAAQYAAREREDLMTGPMNFSREAALTLSLAPDYVLFIYNLGPLSWTGANAISKGSAGRYNIQACDKGMPFTKPLIIPSIVVDTYMVENEMKTHSMRGEDLCIDIVHPAIGKSWSVGQNLDDFGVFWSKNNPPTQEEIRTARTKMEKTFRNALAEATTLEAIGNLKDITPMMRFAADYFEEDRPWNKIYRKTAECPGCGGPTKGTAVHTCGAVLDWPKAIALGLKTRKDAEAAGYMLDEIAKSAREPIADAPIRNVTAGEAPAPKPKKSKVDLAAKARDRAKKK
jgi:hypothetical protein